MKDFPVITAVEWLAAKEVLGGEASDFTPWLQQPHILEILGRSLKLEDLTAVGVEHNVLGKRLDILATALDESGDEVAICIENQYGMSDADHLGRLIAYLSQHERGRAVWVVEQAHDAFVAAVRFLNRTSTDDFGYYLVQVRLTHGPEGGYQVHFEVLAAPLAWEAGSRKRSGKPVNHTKVDFLDRVHERVRPGLLAAGFTSMNAHARGAYLWVRWPLDLWFEPYGGRLDLRITKHSTLIALYVLGFDSKSANVAGAAILRTAYEASLLDALPDGTSIDWDTVGAGQRKPIRLLRNEPGGFLNGDDEAISTWCVASATAVLEVFAGEPIHDFVNRVKVMLPEATLGEGDIDEDD